ncbi:MAG: hypothetical protein WA913_07695 [Pricia sp.]
MMDELDLLKKDWQKKGNNFPKLSHDEIYRMLWKRSSSIVKWIFYISIIELAFWIVLSVMPFFWKSYQEKFDEMYADDDQTFFLVSTIFSFSIILLFVYFLYKAYRAISIVDNVKKLMESILRTRRIVRYYVIYNLIMAVIISIYTLNYFFTRDEKTMQMLETIREDGSELRFWLMTALLFIMSIGFMIGFIWLFYRLVYGILLKRLHKNYKELKRLEV